MFIPFFYRTARQPMPAVDPDWREKLEVVKESGISFIKDNLFSVPAYQSPCPSTSDYGFRNGRPSR